VRRDETEKELLRVTVGLGVRPSEVLIGVKLLLGSEVALAALCGVALEEIDDAGAALLRIDDGSADA